ncbi:unnamed protein product, partial [Cyprideis torosa]
VPVGLILVDQDADLEQVRQHITRLADDLPDTQRMSKNWSFLDSCTAERFFRIDRAQEHLHYVTDISGDDLFILDPDLTQE